jgi:hypothetical protein
MIEQYGHYQYEIMLHEGGVYYLIFDPDYKPTKKTIKTILCESDGLFDSAFDARFAAIGHITQLEKDDK